jgi:hypothetical protein
MLHWLLPSSLSIRLSHSSHTCVSNITYTVKKTLQAYQGEQFSVFACVLKENTVWIGFRMEYRMLRFGTHDVNILLRVKQIEYETETS